MRLILMIRETSWVRYPRALFDRSSQRSQYGGRPPLIPKCDLRNSIKSFAFARPGIKGPIVLVGHSYGGAVITNAAMGNDNVKALVYVAAFAPDKGESAFDLVGKFPGSLLGAALAAPVTLSEGGHDLYVDQVKFREPFAADLPEFQVRLVAATLRPVTDAALKEPSDSPAWKTISSWFIYGSADKSIPAETHAFMAKRAGAKSAVVVKGASHVVMISQPAAVAQIIEEAAASVK
jgi:pimeloyl-ACP methyl ester carboxylesterase